MSRLLLTVQELKLLSDCDSTPQPDVLDELSCFLEIGLHVSKEIINVDGLTGLHQFMLGVSRPDHRL